MSKFTAKYYTLGKFGKRIRETLDTMSGTLYSRGQYKTKLSANDIPEYYCPIHSRSIWYMKGWLLTKGVTDIAYTYCKENHLFKDDYIYLAYDGKLERKDLKWGGVDFSNGLAISGNDILNIILYVEKYSPDIDTSIVRSLIAEKVEYLHQYESDYYHDIFHTDELVDVFEYYDNILPKL